MTVKWVYFICRSFQTKTFVSAAAFITFRRLLQSEIASSRGDSGHHMAAARDLHALLFFMSGAPIRRFYRPSSGVPRAMEMSHRGPGCMVRPKRARP